MAYGGVVAAYIESGTVLSYASLACGRLALVYSLEIPLGRL